MIKSSLHIFPPIVFPEEKPNLIPRSSSSGRANYVNGVYSCNGMNELRINTGGRTGQGGGLILYGVSISWVDLTTCQFLCS